MTIYEINEIKAKMLDDMHRTLRYESTTEVEALLHQQEYTLEIIGKSMERQNQQLKENGYKG